LLENPKYRVPPPPDVGFLFFFFDALLLSQYGFARCDFESDGFSLRWNQVGFKDTRQDALYSVCCGPERIERVRRLQYAFHRLDNWRPRFTRLNRSFNDLQKLPLLSWRDVGWVENEGRHLIGYRCKK